MPVSIKLSTCKYSGPVGIRVRIGIQWLWQSYKATKWSGLLDETSKTKVPCHSRCDTIKISPHSKAVSTSLGLNLQLSPRTVTSPYELNNSEWNVTIYNEQYPIIYYIKWDICGQRRPWYLFQMLEDFPSRLNVENALNCLTTCCIVVIYIHELKKTTFKPYQNHIPSLLAFLWLTLHFSVFSGSYLC